MKSDIIGKAMYTEQIAKFCEIYIIQGHLGKGESHILDIWSRYGTNTIRDYSFSQSMIDWPSPTNCVLKHTQKNSASNCFGRTQDISVQSSKICLKNSNSEI